jgi:hypothetical protein
MNIGIRLEILVPGTQKEHLSICGATFVVPGTFCRINKNTSPNLTAIWSISTDSPQKWN